MKSTALQDDTANGFDQENVIVVKYLIVYMG